MSDRKMESEVEVNNSGSGLEGLSLEEQKKDTVCTVLAVWIESAEDLKAKDWFSKNDPFAVVKRGENVSITKVFREAGDNVKFDWIVHFIDRNHSKELNEMKESAPPEKVEISILDQDSKRTDDIIGTYILDFSSEENAALYMSNANGQTEHQQPNRYIHQKYTTREDRKKYVISRSCEIYEPGRKKPTGIVKIRFWRRTWEDYLNVGLDAYLNLHGTEETKTAVSAVPRWSKPLLRQYYPLFSFPLPTLQLDINENRTAGFVLRLLDGRILEEFCTYQVKLWYVHEIFEGEEHFKGWNRTYESAIRIFSKTSTASLIRSAIRHEHKTLYNKRDKISGKYKRFLIEGMGDLLSRIGFKNSNYFSTQSMSNNRAADSHCSKFVLDPLKKLPIVGKLAAPVIDQHVNSRTNIFVPDVSSVASTRQAAGNDLESVSAHGKKYTYAITPEKNVFYFSETAISKKQTGQDFLSKHALHANASEKVAYAGEFFVDACSEHVLKTKSLRLIIDNNSGTYGPEKENLWRLQKVLEANFGNGCCLALDREDEELQRLKLVNNIP